MRILLVEDNRRLHLSLRASLEEDGYAVDSTYDGEEALDYATVTPYDVIILDVMLPKKDGYQVSQELRAQHINIPI